MRVTIKKGAACGTVCAPPSKSMAHRMLICAALCNGESVIHGISDCEDVAATMDCLAALGIECLRQGDNVTVKGKDVFALSPNEVLKCRESGSTLRFLVPVAMLLSKSVMFSGAEQLMRRPMDVYRSLAQENGLVFLQDGETIVVKGPLKSGEYSVVGNVSSQFISGLLFALPLLSGDSTLKISTPIESRSYINMTIYALSLFGIKIDWADERTLLIKGNQKYNPCQVQVEGDYSNASFFEALNLFGSSVEVSGLVEDSTQGDSVYRKYFEMFDNGIPSIHLGDCPDLGPILFAVAAAKNGGVFSETRRLRIKESDRGAAMAEELKKFGVAVRIEEDSIVVYPSDFHSPNEVLSGHNDHRIVMSLAILLTITGGSIDGAEAVNKSNPNFFRTLQGIGIEVIYENN